MKVHKEIVALLAEASVEQIARRAIASLQRMREGLQSGDDSGLETIWDEICVQVQGEQSVLWDLYDEVVHNTVAYALDRVPRYCLQAIWLQTDNGIDWLYDEAEADQSAEWSQDDVVSYITQKVYESAENWSNHRIRAYLDCGYEMDD